MLKIENVYRICLDLSIRGFGIQHTYPKIF